MKKYDVAIVGAGAAGTVAAIVGANNGKRVVLIEKNQFTGSSMAGI